MPSTLLSVSWESLEWVHWVQLQFLGQMPLHPLQFSWEIILMICNPKCASLAQNDRKMRPSNITFLGLQNSKTCQKMHKILKFHNGLQTFLLTSAGQAALLGRLAGTGQQVTLKAIVEIQNFSFSWLCTDTIDPQTLTLERPYFSRIKNDL